MMRAIIDAVTKAQHELDKRNYNAKECVTYIHPETYHSHVSASDYATAVTRGVSGEQPRSINGTTVGKTENVPTGLLVLVHPDAAVLGPGAIQFQEVEERGESEH